MQLHLRLKYHTRPIFPAPTFQKFLTQAKLCCLL